ncbi:unnamed protein product [Sympodiomycopsis kandeliae]
MSSSSNVPHHIVVGSGVFGTSTALALVSHGHRVTVLDRSVDGFVAPDGASSDLNKIIRADYSDPFYRVLGKEAISEWRTNPLFTPYFHETGVLFHSGVDNPSAEEYIDSGIRNGAAAEDGGLERASPGKALPPKAYKVTADDEEKRYFPKAMRKHLGPFADKLGREDLSYYNPRGGWAEARAATVAALKEAQRQGARVVGRAEVAKVIYKGDKATGVTTRDGRNFYTENDGAVIICAGAWTSKLAASFLPRESAAALQEPAISSGQTVITVQLDAETARDFKGTPVIFDIKTGFYTFEPDSNGVMKAAIHGPGYTHPAPPFGVASESITYPSFESSSGSSNTSISPNESMSGRHTTDSDDGSRILTNPLKKPENVPAGFDQEMYGYLIDRFPILKTKSSNLQSRICWYSDTEDENWIIDAVPGNKYKNLILTTGDSGHGFKFLPTIGQYILARLPQDIRPKGVKELTEYQKRVWSIQHHLDLQRKSRESAANGSHDDGNVRAKL